MAIRPTFYGFEMARSALTASQKNIDVTGQNIANINTAGYSRQRVDLSAVGAGGINWKHTLLPSDNIGLGVNVDGINRMRDEFLDVRFWKENSDNGRFNVKADTLDSLSNLLDEFVNSNVHTILGEFNDALQELHENADSAEFINNTKMVAETLMRALNKISLDINDIKQDQITKLGLRKDDINHIAKCLDSINTEIRNQTLLGPVSNELLDQRDLLLDQLSLFGNVTRIPEAGGGLSVYFGIGEDFETRLVDGKQEDYIPETDGYYNIVDIDMDHDPETDGPYRLTWASGDNAGYPVEVTSGEVFGYYEMINGIGDVNMHGTNADQATKGIPFFLNILDNFTQVFADEFNKINGDPLFDSMDGGPITAKNIKITQEWRDDPLLLVRSTRGNSPAEAANDNVFRMINALNNTKFTFDDGYVGTFVDYVGSLNSEIAIEENYNNKQLTMSDGLLLTISNLRDSVMTVSEDEEAMNLVKFQKSYNAAARFMTTLDEMLDRIINNLGIVGR